MSSISKKIVCEHCSGQIKYKSDLVVANLFIAIQPYHNDCYAQGLKSGKTFFLGNHPINSTGGTAYAIYSVLLAILALVFVPSEFNPIIIIILIPFLLRLVSYFLYERHLMN